MAIGIPPWIASIDPVAPVGRLLEGFRTGLQAGEAQTSAAQRAQQMAFAQAQAAENARIRQEQNQLEAKQFEMMFRLKEKEAERQAQEAAMQLEGMQTLEKRIAAGEPFEQVWAEVAPKVLYRHPERIPEAVRSIRPPIFGTTPEGLPYAQNPRTGGISFPPASAMRPDFAGGVEEFPGGVTAFRVSPQRLQVIGKPQPEGDLNEVQKEQLKDIRAREVQLRKSLQSVPADLQQSQPQFKAMADELKTLAVQRQAVYGGLGSQPEPASKRLTADQAREFLRQAGGDKEKARKLARDAGFEF